MFLSRYHRPVAAFLALTFATSLFARGQFWDFLGYTQVDGGQDHGRVQIVRRDRLFRSIQLRVAGDAIFFDRLVLHFSDGTSQELIVSDRISPSGRAYVIDLSGEFVLEGVEFWYYKELWAHNPRVTVYGNSLPTSARESVPRDR